MESDLETILSDARDAAVAALPSQAVLDEAVANALGVADELIAASPFGALFGLSSVEDLEEIIEGAGENPFEAIAEEDENPFESVFEDAENPFASLFEDGENPFAARFEDAGNPFASVFEDGENPFAAIGEANENPFAEIVEDAGNPFADLLPDAFEQAREDGAYTWDSASAEADENSAAAEAPSEELDTAPVAETTDQTTETTIEEGSIEMENEDTGAPAGGLPEGVDFGQSPFGRLLDLPGIDGPQDIFGNLPQGGDNPFAGGGDPDASGNPFAGGFGGGAGGNPFGGGMPAGGGMPGGGQGGEMPDGGEGEQPEGDDKYVYDFSAFEKPDMGGQPDMGGGMPDGGEGGGMPAGGGNPFGGGAGGGNPFGGGAGGNPFGSGAGGGNPFGGGAGGGNPFGGGAEGGNPFGGGAGGGNPFGGGAGGGNPFGGGAGGNPFGGGMPSGGGMPDGGEMPDSGEGEMPEGDAKYVWNFGEREQNEKYQYDFSAFEKGDEGEEPDMGSGDGGQMPGGGMGGMPMGGSEGGEGGFGAQVVGQPAPGEGMVAITGADGEEKAEYDFSGLEDEQFIFAEAGDKVVVEGGNNKFVVEVRGEAEDGQGSSVVVEGGNNQFVIIFNHDGSEPFGGGEEGGNPFGQAGDGGMGITFGEPYPGNAPMGEEGGYEPLPGSGDAGSTMLAGADNPLLDDPNYVGGDAYVGGDPMFDLG